MNVSQSYWFAFLHGFGKCAANPLLILANIHSSPYPFQSRQLDEPHPLSDPMLLLKHFLAII
jgi:hypothetical protein